LPDKSNSLSVALLSLQELTARHDRRRYDHFGREPYPSRVEGPRAGAKRAPPAGAFAHAGNIGEQGSDDDAPPDGASGRVWRPDVARRRPIGESEANKKPAAIFARARQILDDATISSANPIPRKMEGPRAGAKARTAGLALLRLPKLSSEVARKIVMPISAMAFPRPTGSAKQSSLALSATRAT
jgi:hypothetical protein